MFSLEGGRRSTKITSLCVRAVINFQHMDEVPLDWTSSNQRFLSLQHLHLYLSEVLLVAFMLLCCSLLGNNARRIQASRGLPNVAPELQV